MMEELKYVVILEGICKEIRKEGTSRVPLFREDIPIYVEFNKGNMLPKLVDFIIKKFKINFVKQLKIYANKFGKKTQIIIRRSNISPIKYSEFISMNRYKKNIFYNANAQTPESKFIFHYKIY